MLGVKAPPTPPPSEGDSRPQSGTPPKEESEASSFDMVEQPDTQPDAQLAGLMGSSEGDFPDLTAQVEQLNVAEAEIPPEPVAKSPEPEVDLRSGFWIYKSTGFRYL